MSPRLPRPTVLPPGYLVAPLPAATEEQRPDEGPSEYTEVGFVLDEDTSGPAL